MKVKLEGRLCTRDLIQESQDCGFRYAIPYILLQLQNEEYIASQSVKAKPRYNAPTLKIDLEDTSVVNYNIQGGRQ